MTFLARLFSRSEPAPPSIHCEFVATTAALIGGAIAAAGSVASAAIGAHAAGSAAKTQSDAEQKVADLATKATTEAQTGVRGALQNVNDNLAPYLAAGQNGLKSLNDALAPGGSLAGTFDFTGKDLENEPGYQFQLNEGTKALQRSAAARGSALSGGAQKALVQYGQGLAGTSFQNAYNRALTTFQTNRQNALQPISLELGLGQNAVTASDQLNLSGQEYIGDAGLRGAQITGDALTGKANAEAAGTIGQAKQGGGLASSLANIGQGIVNPAGVPLSAPPSTLPSSGVSMWPGYGDSSAGTLPAAPPVPSYAPPAYMTPSALPTLPNYLQQTGLSQGLPKSPGGY